VKSVKTDYLATKAAYDKARVAYDAKILELDILGAINRASAIEDLDGIDSMISGVAREFNLRELRADMNIAATRLIELSLDIAQSMRPSLDLRGLRNTDMVRGKLIELALALPGRSAP
jgi:hypothetical protein